MLTNVTNFGVEQTPAALLHQEMTGGNVYINGVSPDLIQGSPISRHSYVNQAVNFSPAHYSTLQNQRQIIR